jgi:hypothetical protein
MIHDRVLAEYRRMMSARQVLGWKGICIRYGFLLSIYVVSGSAILVSLHVFPNWLPIFHLGVGIVLSLLVLWLASPWVDSLMKAYLQRRHRDDGLFIAKKEMAVGRPLKAILIRRFERYLATAGLFRTSQLRELARIIRDSHTFRLRNSGSKFAMIAIFVCIMIGFLQILLQPFFTPITAIPGLQWFTLLVFPTLMISPLYLQSPWTRSSVDNCVDLIEHLALEKDVLPNPSRPGKPKKSPLGSRRSRKTLRRTHRLHAQIRMQMP